MRSSTIILIIATLVWGTLLGGIVYSHIVYFPPYLSDLPKSAVIVNGPYALEEGTFWMMIHPVLILSLIIALISNWRIIKRRKLILISFVLYAIVLIISALYFIPELMNFKNSPTSGIPASEWLSRSHRWMICSIIRGTFMYIGIIPLFVALTKPATIKTTAG